MKGLRTLFWRWWYRHHPGQSKYTKEEALAIAKEHELDAEVLIAIKNGRTPDKALQEWDIYPYDKLKRLLGLAVTSLLLMTACEREVISEGWPEMDGFYSESFGLQMATTDSVRNFSMKVDDFTTKFPESKEHSLFPKIQAKRM